MENMSTDTIKLLPCPFCGGEAKTGYAINDYNRWGVTCTSCEACVEVAEWKGVADTEENAIKAWNTRKPMQEIVKKLEEECKTYRNSDWLLRDKAIKVGTMTTAMDIVKEVGGLDV